MNDNMKQFIVTLPSNASNDRFSQNRPSNYKTQLPHALELGDDWEVALVDMQYPLNWGNFTKRTRIVFCYKPAKNTSDVLPYEDNSMPYPVPAEYPTKGPYTYDQHWRVAVTKSTVRQYIAVAVIAQPAYYSSVQQFGEKVCQLINDALGRVPKAKIKLRYAMDNDTETGVFYTMEDENANKPFSLADKAFFLTDDEYAMHVLGFEPSKKVGKGTNDDPLRYQYTLKGLDKGESMEVDKGGLDRPFSIYVYTDIVKPQLVGDVHAPLLGVVPVFRSATVTSASAAARSTADQLGYWNFNPAYYLPLRFARFDTIDLVLCTDEGVELKFTDEDLCKVVCRLHFQKRSAVPL